MPKGTHSANFGTLESKGFQVEFLSHAKAILDADFPEAVKQICDVLGDVTIPIEEIIAGGWRRSQRDTTASKGTNERRMAQDRICS